MERKKVVKKSFVLIWLFCLVQSWGMFSAANSWGAGKTPKVITLKTAIQIALEQNKDIHKAREYKNLVQGRYVEERAAALPQLTLTGNLSRNRDETLGSLADGLYPLQNDTRSIEVGITQVLYAFGQVGAAIRAAKIGLATAEDQLRIFQQAVMRDVSSSFYDVLLAHELKQIAAENLEQKKRLLDEARKKNALGTATEYDVLAAEVDVENARPPLIRAENLIQISKERLWFLLAIDGKGTEVEGNLQVSPRPYPGSEEAVQTAWKNRPDLSDLAKRVGVGQELVKIYDAGDKPRIDFKAGYGWRELDYGDMEGQGQVWTAGVYLSFPFFDGLRTRGKVAQAQSDVRTLKIEQAKLRDSISLQVQEAINALRESTEIMKALGGTVKQAAKLLYLAEKGFEFGVKTKLEVDDAQVNLIQAKGNLAKARRDYLVARVNLEWVMGTITADWTP